MPNANDLRKTLTDPTPFYFAAGVLDKLREEAPERIAAVREKDPKELQARLTKQAKETQAKVSETLGEIDTDVKKLREQAQHLALQSLGYAAEYAVKARETYDELAERGREAVQNWRGEDSPEAADITVEREPVKVAEPPAESAPGVSGRTTEAKGTGTAGSTGTRAGSAKGTQNAKSAQGAKPAQGARSGAAGNGAKSEPKSTRTTSSDSSDSSASSASSAPSSPSATSSKDSAKKTGATRKTTNPNGKTAPKTES